MINDYLTIFNNCKSIRDYRKVIHGIVNNRISNGKKLAKKFPELKGLSFNKFMEKLPMELDFITASEMHKELNK